MRKRGKLFAIVAFAMLLALSFALAACHHTPEPQPQPQPTEKILELSRSSVELDMHESVLLTVVTEGEGAIEWRSSNNAIATVENGLVKAVAAGKATVTATRGEYSGTCSVTVVNSLAAPLIVLSVPSIVEDKGQTVDVDASVTYKGNAVSDHAQFTWSYAEGADQSVATFTADGARAQIVLNEYGESAIDVSTVVWGIPVTRRIEIRVCNTSVTFSSELDEAHNGYLLTLDTVADDGYTFVSADAKLTVTDNGASVDADRIEWKSSDASVATASGNIVTSGGRAGAAVLTGSYNNNFVRIFVTCESVNVTLTDTWTLELKGQTVVEYKFSEVMGGGKMRGAPQAVEIPYTEFGAAVASKRDIFKSYDAETDTLTVTPPTRAANMGKIGNVTVTTDAAVYTLPMEIYTLIISDADELDKFGEYTKYQWDDAYVWDGYFILDADITYNSAENVANINENTRFFKPFIYADHYNRSKNTAFFAADESDDTKSDAYMRGFVGMFDGRGHVIEGLIVDGSTAEKNGNAANTYYGHGGFIGMLGSLKGGASTNGCGTIQNVSFTNVKHGKYTVGNEAKGTTGGFLFSMGVQGIVKNVYVQVAELASTSNGLLNPIGEIVNQTLTAENFVVSIEKDAIEWKGHVVLGPIKYWGDNYDHLRNVYVVNKQTNSDNAIDLSISAGENKINSPATVFHSVAEFAEYLSQNDLTVLDGANWDKTFWMADENGAPIPRNGGTYTLECGDTLDYAMPGCSYASSDASVATVSSDGVVTAVTSGSVIITASAGGATVAKLFVTVVKKPVELAGKWELELSRYFTVSDGKKTPSKQLSLSASDLNTALGLSGDKAIASTDSVLSINLVKGNDTKEILISKNASAVVIEPPYRHSDGMGDGFTAVIETTDSVYKIACAVYTMIIDSADELDEFGEYTKYQRDSAYQWDGYFVLGKDIVYNTVENLADKEGNCKVNSNTRMFKPFICNYYRNGNDVYFDAEHKQRMAALYVGFMGMFDGRGRVIDGLVIDNSENENDGAKTNAYFGGFIGMLGTLENLTADYSKRGTIQNVSFTNVVHGIFDGKGTAGGFLFSANIYGVVENVYMHILHLAGNSNGLLSPAANTVQTAKMHNVVVNIEANGDKINYSWGNNALGILASWDAPNEHRCLRNVYTVRPKRDGNMSIAGTGSQNYTGTAAPTQAFENTAALATYLTDNNLTVTAENDWDMSFWTTDDFGAPIPVTVKAAA